MDYRASPIGMTVRRRRPAATYTMRLSKALNQRPDTRRVESRRETMVLAFVEPASTGAERIGLESNKSS
jgi:hypothetical protein